MKIGIDISQTAYSNTGVANYLTKLVQNLVDLDKENEYVLFFSSMRKKVQSSNPKIKIMEYRFPPVILDLLWNRLHILPIEWLIGDVDVFITSDWTEPPALKAKKMTILYDLVVYKYPSETAKSIIETQKRKLKWAKKESTAFLCISESTKMDAQKILGIAANKLYVVYPGI